MMDGEKPEELGDEIYMPHTKLVGCYGKTSFDTISLAKRVATRRARRGRRSAVYKCRHCRKYHIGTPNTYKPWK